MDESCRRAGSKIRVDEMEVPHSLLLAGNERGDTGLKLCTEARVSVEADVEAILRLHPAS